MENVWWTC